MQIPFTRAIAVTLLTLLITTPVAVQAAEGATTAKCQTVKDRIERYTDMRRKGGSASQMEKWKEQLRASEEAFRQLDCSRHRRKLR